MTLKRYTITWTQSETRTITKTSIISVDDREIDAIAKRGRFRFVEIP